MTTPTRTLRTKDVRFGNVTWLARFAIFDRAAWSGAPPTSAAAAKNPALPMDPRHDKWAAFDHQRRVRTYSFHSSSSNAAVLALHTDLLRQPLEAATTNETLARVGHFAGDGAWLADVTPRMLLLNTRAAQLCKTGPRPARNAPSIPAGTKYLYSGEGLNLVSAVS